MAFDSKTARNAGSKSSRQGVPNKTNAEIRDAFKFLVSEKLPKLSEWIDLIAEEKPEKAVDLCKDERIHSPKTRKRTFSGRKVASED